MDDRTIYKVKIDSGGDVVVDDSQSHLFPWWSFTKTVIAVSALQLVAQGRLVLDDVLPDRPYSLRQLLQHCAGVPNYGRLTAYHEAVQRGDEPWTQAELLERVGADNLDFAPGTGWAYSNVGYFFVRQIIEAAADADIGAAMQSLVFGPLGLQSASLVAEPGDLDGIAWGNPNRYHPGWVYHGLLIGSASDAARLLDTLMSGRLLPPDLLEIMKARHPIGGPVAGRPWETTGYGLGLMTGRMSVVGQAIGHSGGGPENVCAVYHFPELEPSCTVATFAQGSDEGVTEHAAAQLAAQ